jgi:hypothetical protein
MPSCRSSRTRTTHCRLVTDFDKDHTGSYEFCPDLSQRVNRIELFQSREECNLKKKNESSKQCKDNQHASNLSLIILDEHKNLHIDSIYMINGSAVPGGMLHAASQLYVFV